MPSHKVYVAASSRELARAEGAIQALRDLGHEVTHDWPRMVRAVGEANPADADDVLRLQWAEEDLLGIRAADTFWLLMPDYGGFGAGVELGYALGNLLGYVRVIVSGQHTNSIFTVYADAVYPTDLAALKAEFVSEVP